MNERKVILEELRVALKIDDAPINPDEIMDKTDNGDLITPIDQGQHHLNKKAFLKIKK